MGRTEEVRSEVGRTEEARSEVKEQRIEENIGGEVRGGRT